MDGEDMTPDEEDEQQTIDCRVCPHADIYKWGVICSHPGIEKRVYDYKSIYMRDMMRPAWCPLLAGSQCAQTAPVTASRLVDDGAGGMADFKQRERYGALPNSVFLNNWQTDFGLTSLGMFITFMLNVGGANMDITAGSFEVFAVITIIQLIYIFICFVYAASIYPSLFTTTPKAQSPNTISFLNGFLGFVIFGSIWNSNLTKGRKGISHIVYIVIVSIILGLSVFSYFNG